MASNGYYNSPTKVKEEEREMAGASGQKINWNFVASFVGETVFSLIQSWMRQKGIGVDGVRHGDAFQATINTPTHVVEMSGKVYTRSEFEAKGVQKITL